MALLVAAGCATSLISSDVERQGSGWTIVLQRLAVGGDAPPMGYTIYQPERGQTFIHAYLKVRNDGPRPGIFGYNACDLDLGDESVLPTLVSRYNGVAAKLDENEAYAAGESNYRHLIFSYPEGRLPTRLRCADMMFAIPNNTAPGR